MIIGLHGKAGAGKDAFADRLVEKHGFVKRGFAAPLYEEVAAAFGVSVEWMQDRSRKEVPQRELALAHCRDAGFKRLMGLAVLNDMPQSPRWVLQRWGTEYRRGQSLTYCVDQMRAFCDRHQHVVIPDTRFENEAVWVHENDGFVIKIHRSGLEHVEGGHSSAAGLSDSLIDYTVWNDKSLEALHGLADRFIDFMAVELGG